MRILVLGGTQFFGRKAVERLLEQGHEVSILSRGVTPLPWEDGEVTHVIADRTIPGSVTDALGAHKYDVVYDNTAQSGQQVRDVLQALGDTGQYLLMSSGAVYHHSHHVPAGDYIYSRLGSQPIGPFDDWTVMMVPLTEDAAPCDLDWYEHELSTEAQTYRKGKLEAERELVWAVERDGRGLRYTLYRPPQVDGPWDPTRRTDFFARRVSDGAGVLVPLEMRGRVFQKAYRDDVADAVIRSVDNPRAHDRAYNVAQPELLTTERYLYVIADCLGVYPPRILSVPTVELQEVFGPEYAVPVPRPKTLLVDRAKNELKWEPTPLLSWMSETLHWLLDQPAPEGYGDLRRREVQYLASKF